MPLIYYGNKDRYWKLHSYDITIISSSTKIIWSELTGIATRITSVRSRIRYGREHGLDFLRMMDIECLHFQIRRKHHMMRILLFEFLACSMWGNTQIKVFGIKAVQDTGCYFRWFIWYSRHTYSLVHIFFHWYWAYRTLIYNCLKLCL